MGTTSRPMITKENRVTSFASQTPSKLTNGNVQIPVIGSLSSTTASLIIKIRISTLYKRFSNNYWNDKGFLLMSLLR